ncbi:hypothetical protein CHS0354_000485 [Potamilus streckersoni]|uniref:DNA-directed DNA polymerase n=1 Tax=Potamilus streckersoni TaxID=2493646 RepID=A0AAE0T7W2_9BIVA|nr:hypothetical protein CHS0354_000485 [Potamilus streckersoni]
MYGYLGFKHGIFNDYAEADRVTSTGQNIARMMMREFEKRGSRVVEIDTDGIFLIPPQGIDTEDKEVAMVQEVSQVMPKGIQIGYDGRFKKMISYKKKNYVLLDYKDQMKIKGSSLVSRSNERFGRDFVKEGFRLLLQEDVEGLRKLYLHCRERIVSRTMTIEEISKTESLKKTMEEYEKHLREKKGKAATFELAKRKKIQVTKGDRLTYYIAGTGAGSSADMAKLASEWNPNAPDLNVDFYLLRLKDFIEKFTVFFDPTDFSSLFSIDELFPVDTGSIKIIREIPSDTSENEMDEVE